MKYHFKHLHHSVQQRRKRWRFTSCITHISCTRREAAIFHIIKRNVDAAQQFKMLLCGVRRGNNVITLPPNIVISIFFFRGWTFSLFLGWILTNFFTYVCKTARHFFQDLFIIYNSHKISVSTAQESFCLLYCRAAASLLLRAVQGLNHRLNRASPSRWRWLDAMRLLCVEFPSRWAALEVACRPHTQQLIRPRWDGEKKS